MKYKLEGHIGTACPERSERSGFITWQFPVLRAGVKAKP